MNAAEIIRKLCIVTTLAAATEIHLDGRPQNID
jgi:hypothetical protein